MLIEAHIPMMAERGNHRRCASPRARRKRRPRSPSSSSGSSSYSDGADGFSRRDRCSRRRNSRSRSRSRSPLRFEARHGYRRQSGRRSRSRDNRDAARRGDSFLVDQRGNRHGEERRTRRVHSAKVAGESRRIAPNASALQSIMLGTARSRDRMDGRERARAKKKLESLDAAANSSTQ